MGQRPTNSEALDRIMDKVGPVSINNVYNFVGKGTYLSKSINLKTAADRLYKWGLAKRTEINELYPKRFTTLYSRSDRKIEKFQSHQFSHDSAVRDVAVAFYCLFEEKHKFTFKAFWEVKFDHGNGFIKPDVFIDLKGKGEDYHFIVEVETKRKPNEIYKEKIEKYLKVLKKPLNPLKNIGSKPEFEKPIDKRTKIVFFVTPYEFNRLTFARPEVSEKEARQFQKKDIQYIHIDEGRKEKETKHAIDLTHLINHPNFLVLPFHQFTQLDKPVFLQKNGSLVTRRHLINHL